MTLSTQFYTLIAMIGMGSYFGAALDTYQLFLKRPIRSRWLVFIHDLLFWVLQAVLIFYVLFIVNQGEIRLYLFLALVCGFAAYQALLKKGYLFILNKIISFCKATLNFLKKLCMILIVKPILSIITLLFFVIKLVLKGLFTLVKMLWRVVIWCLRLVFFPIVWILRLFYNILPKPVTNKVEKLHNKTKGFFGKLQKYISSIIDKWKSKMKR
ncbi:spore cortex biosynthesis protein YabQ [Bacillus massiliigorillae]|uniref:spore cortex biosynthesis protein YabQ n=1 Tax=Bacillus massiliigorillae TaxID=1243664 RepID=UPI00039B9884|nr:spore cortex biosynthesis protein YabQ [Bacillus massiliigorillae]